MHLQVALVGDLTQAKILKLIYNLLAALIIFKLQIESALPFTPTDKSIKVMFMNYVCIFALKNISIKINVLNLCKANNNHHL